MGVKCRQLKTSTFQTLVVQEKAITIHEGKNRQIRRMCAAAGLHVKRLKRVQEHALKLGALPVGVWRDLTEQELHATKSK